MTVRQWLRALDPRRFERQASRVEVVAAATKATREDVRHLQRVAEQLRTDVRALAEDLARLRALADGEHNAGLRLDALVTALDYAALADHVRRVVANAEVRMHPVPHCVIDGLLPRHAYAVALESVPPPVFASVDRGGRRIGRVPPVLAPTPAMAAWTVLAEMARETLVPAVVERLSTAIGARGRAACSAADGASFGVDLAPEPGRLVYLSDTTASMLSNTRPWEWVTVDVCLGGALAVGGGEPAAVVPFAPNRAVVAVTTEDGRREVSLARSEQDVAAFVWETRAGLSLDARRRLLGLMTQAERERWTRIEEDTR